MTDQNTYGNEQEDVKEYQDRIIEKTGTCRFCRQVRMVSLTEDEWLDWIQRTNRSGDDIADFLAAQNCTCKEGQAFRLEQRVFAECETNIDLMFGKELPEIADTFQRLKAAVWHEQIRSIVIRTPNDITASMAKGNGNIKLKCVEKKCRELVTVEGV